MKQHLELGIIIAMSAMMVFGTAAFVMPFVYASSGGSSTSGANGAAGSAGSGGAGGKGTNPGSTTTGGSSTGGSSTGGSSTGGSHPTTNPPPKNPPPKNTKPCVPGKCLGTPGYYTTNGHHHCFDGAAGCKCTDPHKCTVGSAFIRPDSIMTTV
jgi:hypothetical protein